MTFLDKLDFLMESHGMNKNTFAQKSGIPYTTIDGFYKKGYDNVKLSTLRKIAETFNVTLDFLCDEDEAPARDSLYTGEEKALIRAWRQAGEKTRRKVAIELEDYGFVYVPKEKEEGILAS